MAERMLIIQQESEWCVIGSDGEILARFADRDAAEDYTRGDHTPPEEKKPKRKRGNLKRQISFLENVVFTPLFGIAGIVFVAALVIGSVAAVYQWIAYGWQASAHTLGITFLWLLLSGEIVSFTIWYMDNASQFTSLFDLRGHGLLKHIVAAPLGIISGAAFIFVAVVGLIWFFTAWIGQGWDDGKGILLRLVLALIGFGFACAFAIWYSDEY